MAAGEGVGEPVLVIKARFGLLVEGDPSAADRRPVLSGVAEFILQKSVARLPEIRRVFSTFFISWWDAPTKIGVGVAFISSSRFLTTRRIESMSRYRGLSRYSVS